MLIRDFEKQVTKFTERELVVRLMQLESAITDLDSSQERPILLGMNAYRDAILKRKGMENRIRYN